MNPYIYLIFKAIAQAFKSIAKTVDAAFGC